MKEFKSQVNKKCAKTTRKHIRVICMLLFALNITFLFSLLPISATTGNTPEIYFNGGKFVELRQGTTYVEKGVVGIDDEDGIITDYTSSGTVDPIVPGTYSIKYKVEDSDGNVVFDTRTVVVVPFSTTLSDSPQDILHAENSTNWGGSGQDTITASTSTSDGGFLVAIEVETDLVLNGNTDDYANLSINNDSLGGNSIVLVKYDEDFNIEWSELIGSSENDYISDIQETDTNEYIFVGWTGNMTNDGSINNYFQGTLIGGTDQDVQGEDAIVGKIIYNDTLNKVEVPVINNVFLSGVNTNINKRFNNLEIDTDGTVIAAGATIINSNSSRPFLVKFDSSLNQVGLHYHSSGYRNVFSRVLLLDDGYVFFTYSNNNLPYGATTGLASITNFDKDLSGTSSWSQTLDYMSIEDAIVTDDGNILVVGNDLSTSYRSMNYKNTTNDHYIRQASDSLLIKIDTNDGSPIYGYFIGGEQVSNAYDDIITNITKDKSGNYVLTGHFKSTNSFEISVPNPYSGKYGIWSLVIEDDVSNGQANFITDLSLHGNLDDMMGDVVVDGDDNIIIMYSSAGQYGYTLRDNDDYDDQNTNDVFITRLAYENTNNIDFVYPLIEESITLDEDLNISSLLDIVDRNSNVIQIDNDIDLVNNTRFGGQITIKFDETNFDINQPGEYQVPYYVYDSNQNMSMGTLSITLNDITAPEMNFDDLWVKVGERNVDYLEGVTVIDNYDQSVSVNDIIVTANNVDTDEPGTYTISYSITDNAGNNVTKDRTVKVTVEERASILFDGDLIIEVNSTSPDYLEGVRIRDTFDRSLTVEDIKVSSSKVRLNKVGLYSVKYTLEDGDNTITVERKVHVQDSSGPSFATNPNLSKVLNVYSTTPNWLDYVIVSDNYDSETEVKVVKDNTNMNAIGTYYVTYEAVDSKNNKTTYDLEISVVDIEAPTIELKGDQEITVNVFDTFDDLGVAAYDNYDSNNNLEINSVSELEFTDGKLSKVGTFRIKYTTTDSSGNVSETIERIVNVIDNEPPVITGIDFKESKDRYNVDFLEGITITDNYDEEIIVKDEDIIRVADLDKPNGNYIVTIIARDSSGNSTSYSYGLYVLEEDADVSGYIMGAAVVILLGGGIIMVSRKQ